MTRLDEGVGRKLTVVSAPAGYGKTALLCDWVHELQSPARMAGAADGTSPSTAWLSIDAGDGDVLRFLNHIIAALGLIVGSNFGTESRVMLESADPPTAETVVTPLLNDLACIGQRLILVLDDYHLIDSPAVHRAIQYLLENQPGSLHLIIAARSDPPLPLARFRAADELNEIRAIDLRFSEQETAEYMNLRMMLSLTPEQVATISDRTEGWPAALHLAALSLADCDDLDTCIAAISGEHRHVTDYLIEEVFSLQSEEVQSFLHATCILGRMSAPVCNALTGRSDCQTLLEELERKNLFVTPLDERRTWFRYHHLFAELLRTRLDRTDSEYMRQLHRSAYEWFSKNGNEAEAIDHAIAAGEFGGATGLIMQVADIVHLRNGEVGNLLRWFDRIPSEQWRSHPRLCIAYAWVLFYSMRITEIEPILRRAEEADSDDGDTISELLMVRASIAGLSGNIPRMLNLYRDAHTRAATPAVRGVAALGVGFSYFASGNHSLSLEFLNEAIELNELHRNYSVALKSIVYSGYVRIEEGRHQHAEVMFEMAFRKARQWKIMFSPILDMARSARAVIALEENDLDSAAESLSSVISSAGRDVHSVRVWHAQVILATVESAQGKFEEALATLDDAEETVGAEVSMRSARERITSCRIRIILEAERTGRLKHLSDEINTYLSRIQSDADVHSKPILLPGQSVLFDRFTYVQALIARNQSSRAREVLEEIAITSQSPDTLRTNVECLLLQALAWEADKDTARAVVCIREAVLIAKSTDLLRVFLDRVSTIGRLLIATGNEGDSAEYARRILDSIPEADDPSEKKSAGIDQLAIEPLSDREQEVLSLIAGGCTNQEIGERLFISIHTVKTHIRNIYAKLDVNNRTLAVAVARRYSLIPEI